MATNDINLAALWVPVMPETKGLGPEMRKAGEHAKQEFVQGFSGSSGGGQSPEQMGQQWAQQFAKSMMATFGNIQLPNRLQDFMGSVRNETNLTAGQLDVLKGKVTQTHAEWQAALQKVAPLQEKLTALQAQHNQAVAQGNTQFAAFTQNRITQHMQEHAEATTKATVAQGKYTEAAGKLSEAQGTVTSSSNLMSAAIGGGVGAAAALAVSGITALAGALVHLVGEGIQLALHASEELVKEIIHVGETYEGLAHSVELYSGATGTALDELKASTANVYGDLDVDTKTLGQTMATLNTVLGVTGEPLEQLGFHVEELKGRFGSFNVSAFTTALSQFGVQGKDADATLASLVQSAKDGAVPLDTIISSLGSNAVVLKETGMNIQQAGAFMSELASKGLPVSTMLSQLSQSQKAFNDAGLTMNDGLKLAAERIQMFLDKGDKASASKISMEVFGTANWAQSISMVQSYMDTINALPGEFDATSASLDNLVDHTQGLGEKWTEVKHQAMEALRPFGEAAVGAIGGVLDKLSGYFDEHRQEIVKWVKDIGIHFIAMLPAIQQFAAGTLELLAPVADFIVDFASIAIQSIAGTAQMIGEVLQWVPGMGDMGRSLIDTGKAAFIMGDQLGQLKPGDGMKKTADWIKSFHIDVPEIMDDWSNLVDEINGSSFDDKTLRASVTASGANIIGAARAAIGSPGVPSFGPPPGGGPTTRGLPGARGDARPGGQSGGTVTDDGLFGGSDSAPMPSGPSSSTLVGQGISPPGGTPTGTNSDPGGGGNLIGSAGSVELPWFHIPSGPEGPVDRLPGQLEGLMGRVASVYSDDLGGPHPGAGPGAETWRSTVHDVLAEIGPSYGITNLQAWEDAIIKQIDTESGGRADPNLINTTDINAQRGTPSKGLLQFIDSTYAAHNILGRPIGDPIGQIAALIPYVSKTYGFNAAGGPNFIGEGHGYWGGGTSGVPSLLPPNSRDTVPLWVEPGEEIINRNAANMFRPWLKWMNAKGLQGGGTAAGDDYEGTDAAIQFVGTIAEDQFGLVLMSGKRDTANSASGKSFHLSGEAGDFADPGKRDSDPMLNFATYMAENYGSQLAELIYHDPRFSGHQIGNGQYVDDSYYANAGDHHDHVHVAVKESSEFNQAIGSGQLPTTASMYGGGTGGAGSPGMPSGGRGFTGGYGPDDWEQKSRNQQAVRDAKQRADDMDHEITQKQKAIDDLIEQRDKAAAGETDWTGRAKVDQDKVDKLNEQIEEAEHDLAVSRRERADQDQEVSDAEKKLAQGTKAKAQGQGAKEYKIPGVSEFTQLGGGFVKGFADALGFGEIFDKPPWEWGIVKLMGGMAKWGLGTANAWSDEIGKGHTGVTGFQPLQGFEQGGSAGLMGLLGGMTGGVTGFDPSKFLVGPNGQPATGTGNNSFFPNVSSGPNVNATNVIGNGTGPLPGPGNAAAVIDNSVNVTNNGTQMSDVQGWQHAQNSQRHVDVHTGNMPKPAGG